MYLKDALNTFGKRLSQQARSNLSKSSSNDTKELYKSLDYDVKVSKNSFEFNYYMETYGKFRDEGVRGVGGVRKTTSKFKSTNNKGKLWKIKGKNSQFKFKDNNKPSVKHFIGWSSRKGLSAYAVRESVWRQGIEGNSFFTNAVASAFKSLPDDIVEAYGLDIESLMKSSLA